MPPPNPHCSTSIERTHQATHSLVDAFRCRQAGDIGNGPWTQSPRITPLALAVFSPPLRGLGSVWGTSAAHPRFRSQATQPTGASRFGPPESWSRESVSSVRQPPAVPMWRDSPPKTSGPSTLMTAFSLPREVWDQRQIGATHSCQGESWRRTPGRMSPRTHHQRRGIQAQGRQRPR